MFLSQGLAIFAMYIPSGTARRIQIAVTDKAIKRVRIEVAI
jgi:hypothetical protein